MRKLIVVLGVVAGVVGVRGATAQSAPELAPDGAEAPPVNSLEPGARALSFSILGIGSGTFGYTRFHSAARSTTWGVRLQGAYRHREGEDDEEVGYRRRGGGRAHVPPLRPY